ncbi:hypothetical protein [Streptomyces sp. NBC_01136]|uniref:hypothetical protein n=1 Tax=Streptomyces sp. NBC_01136 TaxID=2903754 RepID=UPI0038643C53
MDQTDTGTARGDLLTLHRLFGLTAARDAGQGHFPGISASLKSLTGRVNSLWRYAECLPPATPTVSLGEGRTPPAELREGRFVRVTVHGPAALAELGVRRR